MPQSTVLPAQPVEFYSNLIFPAPSATLVRSSTLTSLMARGRPGQNQAPEHFEGGIAPELGVGSALDYFQLGGRPCAIVVTTVNGQATGFRPQAWQPGYDAAAFNPGAFYDPGSVVGVVDFHAALGGTGFVGGADVTGFWFQPRFNVAGQPTMRAGAPGGTSPNGGFGVAVNDDGAGNNQWEFVSYDGVPAILQRTVIGAAIVPDVTEWATFRFTIVAAQSGRAASVSLEVNGAAIVGVQGLAFDDVVLMRPNTLQANSAGFFIGNAVDAGFVFPGTFFAWSLFARFGRFTAAGTEMQAI